MVARKRLTAAELKGSIVTGEKQANEGLFQRDLQIGFGMMARILYTPDDKYKELLKKAQSELSEEKEALLNAASGSEGLPAEERNAAREKMFSLLLPSVANEVTITTVLANRTVAIWNPKISTVDEPAATFGDLIRAGVEIDPAIVEEVGMAGECALDKETMALVLSRSSSIRDVIVREMRRLSDFYQEKKEAELGNSEPSPPTTPEVVSAATPADETGSPSSNEPPSGG